MTSALILVALLLGNDPMASCPLHAKHTAKGVDARHDTLGMSHEATHHNFRLFEDGGAIELHSNTVSHGNTVAAIDTHLKKSQAAFTKSNFSTPEFVHGRTPDGVAEMRRMRRAIRYQYEELPDGARVLIVTRN